MSNQPPEEKIRQLVHELRTAYQCVEAVQFAMRAYLSFLKPLEKEPTQNPKLVSLLAQGLRQGAAAMQELADVLEEASRGK